MVKFIANLTNLVEDEKTHYIVASFEFLPPEKLSPFIEDNSEILKTKDLTAEARQAFYNYFTYGHNSDEFRRVKTAYLGGIELKFATVYFAPGMLKTSQEMIDDPDEDAPDIMSYKDVYLELDTRYNIEFDYDIKLNDPIVCTVDALTLDEDTLGRLKKISVNPKSKLLQEIFKLEASTELPTDRISSIAQNTEITEAYVLNVGAALCTTIYGIDKGRKLLAIYDMGARLHKITIGSKDLSVAQASALPHSNENAEALCGIIKATKHPIDIFISHWHDDHINLILHIMNKFTKKSILDNRWSNITFHVPETTVTAAQTIQKLLETADPSNKFDIKKNFNAIKVANRVKFNNNDCFVVGKINCAVSKSNRAVHPHHLGIFLELKLGKKKAILKDVLLSGDCTYKGIWNTTPKSYHYLQVSHHGGNYALAPCGRNKASFIPKPIIAENSAIAVASTDGSTYSHPNEKVVKELVGIKWKFQATKDCLSWYRFD